MDHAQNCKPKNPPSLIADVVIGIPLIFAVALVGRLLGARAEDLHWGILSGGVIWSVGFTSHIRAHLERRGKDT